MKKNEKKNPFLFVSPLRPFFFFLLSSAPSIICPPPPLPLSPRWDLTPKRKKVSLSFPIKTTV